MRGACSRWVASRAPPRRTRKSVCPVSGCTTARRTSLAPSSSRGASCSWSTRTGSWRPGGSPRPRRSSSSRETVGRRAWSANSPTMASRSAGRMVLPGSGLEPCPTNRRSRRGRHDGIQWYEAQQASTAAELCVRRRRSGVQKVWPFLFGGIMAFALATGCWLCGACVPRPLVARSKEMSPTTRFRALACACGVLVALTSLLSWPLSAADVEAESDVDLTLSEGGSGFTNSVGMKLVRIKAGKFMMGAPNDEKQSVHIEKPRHQVEITKDYYLGVHEVTQKQYKAVMGTTPSDFSKDGKNAPSVKGMDTDDFPVENVSWLDAQEFLTKLNALAAEKGAGRKSRLPTEAEWEYGCRGGADVKEPFSFEKPSASASSTQANFNGNNPYGNGAKGPSLNRPCKVGSYKANAFGLYDMHGNILEWCQ